jgi:putative membrane protein
MEYMFQSGFLGTKAPLFMDEFIVIIALLPFLIALSIWFAIKGYYKLHRFFQTMLFITTLSVLVYFEYGIHKGGGFEYYLKNSSIDPNLALYFLIFHIIVATITLIMWVFIINFATSDNRRKALPGLYSNAHKKSGKRVAFMIFLTSLTGIGVYSMLFMR